MAPNKPIGVPRWLAVGLPVLTGIGLLIGWGVLNNPFDQGYTAANAAQEHTSIRVEIQAGDKEVKDDCHRELKEEREMLQGDMDKKHNQVREDLREIRRLLISTKRTIEEY